MDTRAANRISTCLGCDGRFEVDNTGRFCGRIVLSVPCGHYIHKDCLQTSWESTIDGSLRCPFLECREPICQRAITNTVSTNALTQQEVRAEAYREQSVLQHHTSTSGLSSYLTSLREGVRWLNCHNLLIDVDEDDVRQNVLGNTTSTNMVDHYLMTTCGAICCVLGAFCTGSAGGHGTTVLGAGLLCSLIGCCYGHQCFRDVQEEVRNYEAVRARPITRQPGAAVVAQQPSGSAQPPPTYEETMQEGLRHNAQGQAAGFQQLDQLSGARQRHY